ncbi:MAG: hypothetical protein M3362_23575 [Acidobacteriota bacterium]|nr:hypothetical protein [Acidobacteriota bacterium]
MSLKLKVRTSLYHGLIGLAIGSVCGGIIGAAVLGFTSWLRENPEEPAWIFAGTMIGLMFGIIGGLGLGFIIGLFSGWKAASDESMLKSAQLR